MVTKHMENNLVKIKYLFTINQKLHSINSKKQMILTTLLTGSRPPHYLQSAQLTMLAILMLKSLMMTTPRLFSQFQLFFSNPRAPIRQPQMPKTVILSNSNLTNCPRFTLLMLPLNVIIINITVATTTTSALTIPMNRTISLAKPPGLPKRKDLLTERSDSSSTKKLRK